MGIINYLKLKNFMLYLIVDVNSKIQLAKKKSNRISEIQQILSIWFTLFERD